LKENAPYADKVTNVQLWLACLLPFETVALFYGQRKLFWLTVDGLRSQRLAFAFAAPGTALHELSHFIMCVILRVPVADQVGKKTEFFRPRRNDDGSMTLGQVFHGKTDPLRGALIAIAPALLVPPLLLGIGVVLLGTGNVTHIPHAFTHAPMWADVVFVYVVLSAGSAAFPSVGDHVGWDGAAYLLALVAAVCVATISMSGSMALLRELAWAGSLLLLPAISACASLAVLTAFLDHRHSR
jgi:hypothetical protein